MAVSAAQSKDDFLPAAARAAAPYFILLLIVFAAYSNIFDNSFLYDDKVLIGLNEYLYNWSHISDLLTSSTTSGAHIEGGFYRPLQMLLYLLAFQLGGGTTFLFHLLNLALHATNTCFVYRLGTKLGFASCGVFCAALVWGLHPMHTEAVTYMSATADTLFAFFCLWAIIILLPDISSRKILKIIPLFIMGLLSKETAVIFPLLVIVCLFYISPQRLNIRSYLLTWPLWAIALIFIIWRLHADAFYGPERIAAVPILKNSTSTGLYVNNLPYRIYTFLATLPAYLSLIAWPQKLSMERDFPLYVTPWTLPVIMGMGITALAVAQIIQSAKKPNYGIEISWGLLWFTTAHVPDTGILIPMNALFLEHWMYLPSVGLFLGLAETLAKLFQNRSRALFACYSVILVFAGSMFFKTYNQNKVWHDPISFYKNILHYNKHSASAHGNLGVYYSDIGEYSEAFDQFKQSIEISDSLAPVRYSMALNYLRMPDPRKYYPDAIENLQRSLELDPNFYRSYKALSLIYGDLGDKDKAKYYHDREDAILAQHK